MYRDNSLIPSESIRLVALGSLAAGPRPYGELAGEVRQFAGRIVGPSLDLMGPSVELLKVEGLVEAAPGGAGDLVRLADKGREELLRLLTAPPRGPLGGLNKLIVALKMRFLHLLDRDEQILQVELLSDLCQEELVRLTDLRQRHVGEPGHLVDWLDHETAEAKRRLDWLGALAARL
jgi:hypothetical protein